MSVDDPSLHRPLSPDFSPAIQHPRPSVDDSRRSTLSNSHIERLERSAQRLSSVDGDLEREIKRLQREQWSSSSRSPPSYAPYASNILLQPIQREHISSSLSRAHQNDQALGDGSEESYNMRSNSVRNNKIRAALPAGSVVEQDTQIQSPMATQSALMDPDVDAPGSDEDMTSKNHLQNQDAVDRLSTNEHPAHDQATLEQLTSNEVPSRAISNASTSTLKHARSMFRDFDGVHYTPQEPEILEETGVEDYEYSLDDHASRSTSMNATQRRMMKSTTFAEPRQHALGWKEPPPAADLVFYPAPVPLTLKLPKRLSQQPKFPTSAARRSRQSVLTIPAASNTTSEEHRFSVSPAPGVPSNLVSRPVTGSHLPPQLRASVFFDQPSIAQTVNVQKGSAVMTLETMLDESSNAPVQLHSVFSSSITAVQRKSLSPNEMTPHNVDTAYPAVKSGTQQDDAMKLDRSRDNWNITRISQPLDGHALTQDNPRQLGDEQDQSDKILFEDDRSTNASPGAFDISTNQQVIPSTPDSPTFAHPIPPIDTLQAAGAPNTLMAELQLRKQKLRSRNRTAAETFPNGVRSTLLQLDAVAQVENRRRKAQRPALAWEDPDEHMKRNDHDDAVDDDDVPLGVLFARTANAVETSGVIEMERPLGLLEKRQLEESEPLSQRRNRLRGLPLSHSQHMRGNVTLADHDNDANEPQGDESEHDDETLAQRHRRLRSRQVLDDALKPTMAGTHHRSISDDFASEMMSQLGGPQEASNENRSGLPGEKEGSGSEAEETLGQRRKRLQAEAASKPSMPGAQGQAASGHILRSTQSLSSLLNAHPIQGTRVGAENMIYGNRSHGLLDLEEQQRKERQQQLMQQAYGQQHRPLIDVSPSNVTGPTLGMHRSPYLELKQNGNDGRGRTSTMAGFQSLADFRAQPQIRGMLGAQRSAFNPAAMGLNNAGYGNSPTGLAGQPFATAMHEARPEKHAHVYSAFLMNGGHASVHSKPMDASMSLRQRDSINQWRMNVSQ